MTTIMGIDHSLAATGLAVWRDGRFVAVRTLRTRNMGEDPHGWATAERHRSIVGRIVPFIVPQDTVAGVEGRIRIKGDQKGDADLDLAGVRAVIEYALAARGVPIASILPVRVKAYALKGNATKAEVLQAARARLGALAGPIEDDDQADAAWIATMLVHRYVGAIVRTTARQAALIGRQAWPLFTPLRPIRTT
jgi:Holliday junction resolvasome RuvABC endonuclease subunit